jgi:putative ABC transport system permease protein
MDALNHLTGDGDVVSAASLFAEPSSIEVAARYFKEVPTVESVSLKSYVMRSFLDKVAALVLVSAAILTGFGVIIAVGVVYNSARIGLQERAWELASLRVLGFTRAEVSRLLFAELAIEILFAIPIGFLLSQAIINLLVRAFSNESFQVPPFIETRTFAAAAVIVMAAALASGYAVRRRIDRLDLVTVLKTRD